MSGRWYRKYRRMEIELIGKWCPRDRRDLQQWMVDRAVGIFLATYVRLKLFDMKSLPTEPMNGFSRRLFKLVKRRHTHLWDLLNGHGKTVDRVEDSLQHSEVETRSTTI